MISQCIIISEMEMILKCHKLGKYENLLVANGNNKVSSQSMHTLLWELLKILQLTSLS
jgi:hypothetical protein